MLVQNANSIIEALVREMVFNPLDVESCLALLTVLDILMLQFGADRFTPNKGAIAFIFSELFWTISSPKVWPHLEPCWMHGIALSKSVCFSMKELVAAGASFSKLIRDAKNNDCSI